MAERDSNLPNDPAASRGVSTQLSSAGSMPSVKAAGLRGAAADFVGALGRKVSELRVAHAAMKQEPDKARLREELRRKLHALGVGARMLQFEALSAALSEATTRLDADGANGHVQASTIENVDHLLDRIPGLAWSKVEPQAPVFARVPEQRPTLPEFPALSIPPPAPTKLGEGAGEGAGEAATPATLAPPKPPTPTFEASLLVVGGVALASALTSYDATIRIEIEATEDLAGAHDLARALAPDLAVIDVARSGALELIEALAGDPLTAQLPVLAVLHGEDASKTARLRALGAHVAHRDGPLAAAAARALREGRLERQTAADRAIGDVTIAQLADRIAEEVRRALVDASPDSAEHTRVSLGAGGDILGPVWSALARVRDVVHERSHGAVSFANDDRCVPIAMSNELDAAHSAPMSSRGRRRRRGEGAISSDFEVSLEGRVIVVADDDLAVVRFVSDVLRGAGASVIEAGDGLEALHRAREASPDAIVSDVLMPRLDGLGLARTLRRDVVLRDRPVVLISWKEDLLARLRGLRMETQAMLRKESDGATLLARVREVLAPRARLEARIAAGGPHGLGTGPVPRPVEVRGRLDDVSMSTLLSIVARLRHGATVVVRDPSSVFEVEIEEGSIRSLSRAGMERDDAEFVHGPRALAAMLGAVGGRFLVRPASMPGTRAELEGDLATQLRPTVQRLRAACEAVSGVSTVGVASVGFDRPGLARYLASSPATVRVTLEAIAAGASPRSMILAGEIAPSVLEDILVDVALRGLITQVHGPEHEDLLARAERALEEAPRPWTPQSSRRGPSESPGWDDVASGPISRRAGDDSLHPELASLIDRSLQDAASGRSAAAQASPSSPPTSDAMAASLADAVLRQVTGNDDDAANSARPSASIIDARDLKPRSKGTGDSGAHAAIATSSSGTLARVAPPSHASTPPMPTLVSAPSERLQTAAAHAPSELVEKSTGGSAREPRSTPPVVDPRHPTARTMRPRSPTLQGIAAVHDHDGDVFSPARALPFELRTTRSSPSMPAQPVAQMPVPAAPAPSAIAPAPLDDMPIEPTAAVSSPPIVAATAPSAASIEEAVASTERAPKQASTIAEAAQPVRPRPAPSSQGPVAPKAIAAASSAEGVFGWVMLLVAALAIVVGLYLYAQHSEVSLSPSPAASTSH